MRQLRLQFILFFLVLTGALCLLLLNSYRQMNREEERLWESLAEEVYNRMQASISEFLTAEDARPFNEYRYYQALPGAGEDKSVITRSPLNRLPEDDPRGLIGYFQMDPDGSFSTPYLPASGRYQSLPDGRSRRERHAKLKKITQSLQAVLPPEKDAFVELGKSLKESEQAPAMEAPANEIALKNVYPNPVQEQVERLENRGQELKKKAAAPSRQQIEAFEDQATASLGSMQAKPAPTAILEEKSLASADPTEISVNPFQARLVSGDTLVFYRRVWLDRKMYLQGFAVELDSFYRWLMGQSFAASNLAGFAEANLALKGETLARYGTENPNPSGLKPFFERALGYPLNLFTWRVEAAALPPLTPRLALHALTGVIAFLLTVGLYFIYRSASAQVAFSQKRQDFVSSVTHELKTPLTSIRMYSEMLEGGWVQSEDKRAEYYRQINKESSRLTRLVENVLQMARLEKRTYKPDMKQASPEVDFSEWARELGELAQLQGFMLNASAQGGLPAISYDPEAVKQILFCLMDNSFKFARQNPVLEMTLARAGEGIALSFKDRGPGIPEGEREKVFKNFYRVENEMTRKTKGTGIGLAMARMLAQAMGALIGAKNRPEGGLEVELRFPPSS